MATTPEANLVRILALRKNIRASIGSVAVTGQPTVNAGSVGDTVTFVGGTGVSITTNPTTNTITITISGAGGGSVIPLSVGAEPLAFVSDGAGRPILVSYTP